MKIITKTDGWLKRYEIDTNQVVSNSVLYIEFTSGEGQAGHVSVRNYAGAELNGESLGTPPDPPPWYDRGVEHLAPLSEQAK